MTWIIPVTSTNADTNVADSDNLYVAKSIVLGSVFGHGQNQIVEIDGTLASNFDALTFDYLSATAIIHEDAMVKTFGDSSSGINVEGSSSLMNYGTIAAAGRWGDAVQIGGGGTTSGTTEITNSGVIEGKDIAISRVTAGETIRIVNTGVISGGDYAFSATNGYFSGVDSVTNSGTMKGAIDLGGGADLYDGRLGHVKGTVYGGAGDDKLYGGTEANALDGGDNNDRLYGGAGSDTLTGGSGNDRFAFTEALKTAGVDKITDFANMSGNNDSFYLDDAVFKALGSKVDAGEFVTVTSGHAAKQVDDHLIYNTKDGTLWYDADGSGSGAAVQFATLANKAALAADDFAIF